MVCVEQNHFQLRGHHSQVNEVKCHPTHKNKLFSCSKDGSIIVWQLASRGVVERFRESNSTAEIVTMSITSSHVYASCSDGYVKAWNLHTRSIDRVVSFQWEHNFVNQIEIVGGFLVYRVANGKIVLHCLHDDVIVEILQQQEWQNPFSRFACSSQGSLAYEAEKNVVHVRALSDVSSKYCIELSESGGVPFYLERAGKYLLCSEQKLQILQ